MHKVLITHQLPGDKMHELSSSSEVTVWMGPGLLGAEALREELKDCVGVDHIDVAAASERSIAGGNTPGVLVETTADATFALLLAASRRIAEADLYVRGGHWSDENAWSPDFFVGKDVAGATLGIIGLGEVGRAVSRRAKGFGMRVLGWNRREKSVAGIESVSLEQLLNESDFVCITIALAKETRHLIDVDKLALMKHDAVLINTSRGGIVDEEALVDALVKGRLGSAALDVFAREPLAADHPLVRLPNVVLSPHIGSATHETRCKMADMAAANALAALSEQPMPSCVNPEVYER